MKATEKERQALLRSVGLNPEAGAKLPAAPKREVSKNEPVLAPEGVNPHTMPVSDIVFDPALLDDFPSLRGSEFGEASRKVFALYKSPTKDPDRNRRLHDEIGLFINRVRRSRKAGVPHVKEQVRRQQPERDLLAQMREMDVSPEEMQAALALIKGQKDG